MKNFIKKHFPYVALAARTEINRAKALRSRLAIRRLLSERSDICLEIGAGERKGRDPWITLDITGQSDIFWDLRNGVPFPDSSLAKIYSSHLFEHLTFKDGQQLLEECRRVLRPGGAISVCVPNARLYLEAYFNTGSLDRSRAFGWKPAYNHSTAIDIVNYIAYMDGEHKYMFDTENLLFVLKSAGFKNVRARSFDPTIDLQDRDFESIYAEGEK
jgi:predicted SAM-dependent methyltransferase